MAVRRSPHVSSLLDKLMAQTCGIAIFSASGKPSKVAELQVERVKTIERLARQGVTPIEIAAYVAEAEEAGDLLYRALKK